MLCGPSVDSEGKPELSADESILCQCDSCTITFGELTGGGAFYITTQRIVWIESDGDDGNDAVSTAPSRCHSFSAPMPSLMVHALCKEAVSPYLFLQLENQENDIQIAIGPHAVAQSEDLIQSLYNALCEGQRLNPCDDGDEDGPSPFMGLGGFDAFPNGLGTEDEDEGKQRGNAAESALSEDQTARLLKEWDSKLQLDGATGLVDNDGYLEPAADGQFDDAECHRDDAGGPNPYLDPELVKSFDQFAPEKNQVFEEKFATKSNAKNTEK